MLHARRCAARVHFFLAILLTIAAQAAPAHPAGPATADQVQEVVAEGRGAIIQGDTARARDEAIIDARVRALEEVAGVLVDKETLVQNNLLLDSTVRNSTKGWIRFEVILKEWEADETYFVRLRATISPEDLRQQLQDLVGNTSILIHIRESVCGNSSDDRVMESAVIEKLLEAGYIVMDPIQTEKVRGHEAGMLLLEGDVKAAKRARLRFMSNLLARGQAEARFVKNSNGVIYARVTVTIRVVQIDTGRMVAEVSDYSTLGSWTDCPSAARNALMRSGRDLATKLQEKLAEHLNKNKRRVTVIAHGLPDQSAYERLGNVLKGVRWGAEVRLDGLKEDTGSVSLSYPEKTVYLVKAITTDQRYQLVEFSWSKVVIRLAGP